MGDHWILRCIKVFKSRDAKCMCCRNFDIKYAVVHVFISIASWQKI